MEDLVKYDKVIDQGILYSFVPYDTPLLALYKHSTDEYKLPEGWLNTPKIVLVIGETKDSFITELRPSEHGEWKDLRILYKYILPLGFHKSRFIQWEETQLSLF
ncbi:hypothetical protein [Elizabethkingia anophelis]|uniref:hypothetical protein n=1 Tax=Elizabethkingia anophelis TaxID=1117645 RepID=UPI00301B150A|nr:hypothetical protein [Elizabethkingia meningoseptica]